MGEVAHVGCQPRQMQQRGGVIVQRFQLVLGEVADLQALAAPDRAGQRCQRLGQCFYQR